MTSYIIANPPCGMYKGDLPLGYAYYHTLLDIHSRFLTKFKDLDVICHKYSLNAFGKRAEDLGLNGTLEGLNNYVQDWIKDNRLRDKMNFSFEGELLDCDSKSIQQSQKVFSQLNEKGYIIRDGDTYYLDVNKIYSDVDLEAIAENIKFSSSRAKKEFVRLIQKNKEPVRITKDRIYGAQNPLGGENISPIFVVSNLWEGYFNKEIDLMAVSEKELTRYLVLRTYSQAPLSKNLPMKNVLIYNYINPEGGFDKWDLSEITKDGVGSDSLRYAFAKSFSSTKQKTDINKNMLSSGKKLVYLVGNLKKFFLKEGFKIKDLSFDNKGTYFSDMESFKYKKVLSDLESHFREISKEINYSKKEERFNLNKSYLLNEYVQLVNQLSPFCPFISEKVIKDLYD